MGYIPILNQASGTLPQSSQYPLSDLHPKRTKSASRSLTIAIIAGYIPHFQTQISDS